jgi:hypothetical protein
MGTRGEHGEARRLRGSVDQREAGLKGESETGGLLGFHSQVAGGSLRWRVAGEGRGVRPARPRMTEAVIPTKDRLGRHAVPTLPRDKRLTKGGQPYP